MLILLPVGELPKLAPPISTEIVIAQNKPSSQEMGFKKQRSPQLITQERGGARKTFEIPVTGEESETEVTPIPVDSVDVVEVSPRV
jgi:hypothetical protein